MIGGVFKERICLLDPSSGQLSLKLYLTRIEYQSFENDGANAMTCFQIVMKI
jgi:hypothetical protein